MKVEMDVDIDQLIQISTDYCNQLAKADMKYSPVGNPEIIAKLIKTGRMESGLIENEDGYWTIGRRDGKHVLMEYRPLD